jgi:hypothetical protein
MVIGALIGLIPIPVPIIGSVKLGSAGGPLIISLMLGIYGPSWSVQLAYAHGCQYHFAKPWPDSVSCRSRFVIRSPVCTEHRRHRPQYDVGRYCRFADRCPYCADVRLLCAADEF